MKSDPASLRTVLLQTAKQNDNVLDITAHDHYPMIKFTWQYRQTMKESMKEKHWIYRTIQEWNDIVWSCSTCRYSTLLSKRCTEDAIGNSVQVYTDFHKVGCGHQRWCARLGQDKKTDQKGSTSDKHRPEQGIQRLRHTSFALPIACRLPQYVTIFWRFRSTHRISNLLGVTLRALQSWPERSERRRPSRGENQHLWFLSLTHDRNFVESYWFLYLFDIYVCWMLISIHTVPICFNMFQLHSKTLKFRAKGFSPKAEETPKPQPVAPLGQAASWYVEFIGCMPTPVVEPSIVQLT